MLSVQGGYMFVRGTQIQLHPSADRARAACLHWFMACKASKAMPYALMLHKRILSEGEREQKELFRPLVMNLRQDLVDKHMLVDLVLGCAVQAGAVRDGTAVALGIAPSEWKAVMGEESLLKRVGLTREQYEQDIAPHLKLRPHGLRPLWRPCPAQLKNG